jgi:hypothetical protein
MHDFEWALINSVDMWFTCDNHEGFFPNMVYKGFKSEVTAVILLLFDF